jgi:hypothetical protein
MRDLTMVVSHFTIDNTNADNEQNDTNGSRNDHIDNWDESWD